MNTFLPYPLYSDSAKCLDNRRLGKQRVEVLQILNVLLGGKTGWQNHPAVRQWKGFEKQLAIYGLYICNEWIKRGFRDTCFEKIRAFIPEYQFKEDNYIDYGCSNLALYPMPKWLGDRRLHSSHRSNLLRKDPAWYGKFGWTESSDLPYWWPNKEGF